MSDVIKLLPDSVANQIAAGEVIQRPASVVKELVENAVDAGATEIKIIIKDAGRTLIQVVDNGTGMSATDARLAFERHATSKITRADNLFALHTMGFRGEALASICAVAQVDMRTMRHGENVGTRLIINGSKVESQQPEACAPGTNLMVRNLFYNVPARRKFLKKDSVEMSNILHEFERLALVNTQIELSLIHNDVTVHSLPRGNLKQRIVALFGKSLDSQLIPVETDTSLVRICGFVVRPEHSRKRGALQYFFVNGRNMRHPYFHKAVCQCYEGLIPADTQPTYFIDLTVEPGSIDVNIHPTKNEIKFEQEQSIRQILFAAVKETLGRFNAAPSIDFDTATDEAADIENHIPALGSSASPSYNSTPHSTPPKAADTSYNPFRQNDFAQPPASLHNWEELYKNFTAESRLAIEELESSRLNIDNGSDDDINPDDTSTGSDASELMRVQNRYIAMADPRGLRLIDIRRAHITVLYERYMQATPATFASQRLIFPEQVTVNPDKAPLLEEILPSLESMGFDMAPLGSNIWSINGVPSVADDLNPAELITSVLADIADERTDDASSTLRSLLSLSLARATAFRPDRPLSDAEMHHLSAELMSLKLPGFTPSGQPTFILLTPSDIEKLF